MSKKIINIGSGELAGDGESLRSAFGKVNDNFSELYTSLELATGPQGPQGDQGPTGPVGPSGPAGIANTSSLVNGVFVTDLLPNGDLVTSGDLLPGFSNQFNLGSDVSRWNTIYVNTFTLRQAIVTGDYDTDNYTRIRHLENTTFSGGNYSAYGFSSAYEQSTVIINEDANVNQVIFLGDSGPTSTQTLFGVAVADNTDLDWQTPTTGTETTWIKKLELTGQGNLYLNSGTIHVSSSSVFLNGVRLTVTTATGLSINGTPVAGSGTGNVTFDGYSIIGGGTASGDGNGYGTLELVPDGTLQTDQYIIVDPTTPNHIHLRAGGAQDASTAELYLGGERNNVRISDYSGVRLNNNFLNSITSREFVDTTDFTTATWWDSGEGTYFLQFSTPLQELQTLHDQFGAWPDNTIEIWTGSALYTLTYAGYSAYLGNPNDRIIQVREAPPGGTTATVLSMTFTRYILQQNYVGLEYSGFEAVVDQDINLFSNQSIRIATGTGNIQITADDNNSSPSWYFTAQGYLQFPQGLGPTTSKGKEGDEAGSVVVDGTYIYYCTTDYTDGVADIWKRVQWSADTW